MAHSEKTQWEKPALTQLSSDELETIYEKATQDERAKLDDLADQLRQYRLHARASGSPEGRGGLTVLEQGAFLKPGDVPVEDDLTKSTLRDRDIEAAAYLLRALVEEEHDLGREITTLAKDNVSIGRRSDLIERARQTYVNRARRARIFSDAMFGEAAWNMLLALYVTDLSGRRHTVTGLTDLSGVPSTTALRWLNFLETKEGLVRREPKSTDGRVYMVELTDKARQALDAYFSEVVDTGEDTRANL